MTNKTVQKVETIARRLVKELDYTSMADFTASDIQEIADQARVEFTDVIDILQAELI